ncbi:hypothetical protein NC651_005103 [Populus alba x Populus x berolinensis]|nr:hypothetical protein NC651_005103 [Populus alba x Populus x berolinensis]
MNLLIVLNPLLSIPLVSQNSPFSFPLPPNSTLAEADLTFSDSQILNPAEANAFHSLSFSQNPHFFLYFVCL